MVDGQHVHDFFEGRVNNENSTYQNDNRVYVESGGEPRAFFCWYEYLMVGTSFPVVSICGSRDMFALCWLQSIFKERRL